MKGDGFHAEASEGKAEKTFERFIGTKARSNNIQQRQSLMSPIEYYRWSHKLALY